MLKWLLLMALSLAAAGAGRPDSATVNDTTAVTDTGEGIAADTLPSDSGLMLRAGKDEPESQKPEGEQVWGASITLNIPVVHAFERLRSRNENRFPGEHMVQDAETRFEENDICFPLGLVYRRPLTENTQWRINGDFFHIANQSQWTPQEGDTTVNRRYVSRYAFTALGIHAAMEADISRQLITVENFNRLFTGLVLETFPFIRFTTERTDLGEAVDSFGAGLGGSVYLGVERYLDQNTSFTGEIGYGLARWGWFKDSGPVTDAQIFRTGKAEAFDLLFRSLRFRFQFLRWF